MLITSTDAFKPSPVVARLLYARIFTWLAAGAKNSMVELTQEQLKQMFLSITQGIVNRELFTEQKEEFFWIVKDSKDLRPEFIKLIANKLDLHHTAECDSEFFRMRFAEEIDRWFSLFTSEAKRCGLERRVIDNVHYVGVVRKPMMCVS
jgi:hypothetical protein